MACVLESVKGNLAPVKEVFKSVTMLLGLVYFSTLIIIDACVAIAGKPSRIWIPAKSLVISALTIQILSYLEMKIIVGGQEGAFVGESARVVTCVLIGYFMPGMARAGASSDWHTVAALVLSLFTTEFYYLDLVFHAKICNFKFHVYRLVTNGIIMLSNILMLSFSICTILAGKTIRGMLAQKISAIQLDKKKKTHMDSWAKFEGEIMESWFLSHVCHPQYVIARSVLSSAVGLLVLVCIPFLTSLQIYEFIIMPHLLIKHNILSRITWVVEWAFIVIGGTVIFCRWFTAVVYFSRFSLQNVKLRQCTRLFVEDFWTRSISELFQMYNLERWHLQEQSKAGILKGLALRVLTTMKIHYLLYFLKYFQILLVCFSKCCLFISELLFSFKFVWKWFSSQSQGGFGEYREILERVCMPGENPERLWMANKKSLKQAMTHFNENKKKGYNNEKLFEFIINYLEFSGDGRFVNHLESLPLVVNLYPALEENCMRMTALSLLNVIINLLPLYKDVDMMKKCLEAYRQSWDLVSFVDNSDPKCPATIDMIKVIDIESDPVDIAVCIEFRTLLKLQKEKSNSLEKLPNLPEQTAHGRAFEIINDILKEAEEHLKAQNLIVVKQSGTQEQSIVEEFYDSRDWNVIAGSYSKYRVCKMILCQEFNNITELMEYLYGSLADVIMSCLLRLPNLLVKRCREWAVRFEEEKIWDAMDIAGQVVGVMHQKCNVEPKWNPPEPTFLN